MQLADYQESKRGTGRTSRLIEEALRLAAAGRAVYLITLQPLTMQRRVDEAMPGSGIKCESIVGSDFDWLQMRARSSHPNCVWLFDHRAIEIIPQFQAMFEAMTEFDQE